MRQLGYCIDLECTCIGDLIHWGLLHAKPRLNYLSSCISGAHQKHAGHMNGLGRAPQAFTAEGPSSLPGYDIACTDLMGSDAALVTCPGRGSNAYISAYDY